MSIFLPFYVVDVASLNSLELKTGVEGTEEGKERGKKEEGENKPKWN